MNHAQEDPSFPKPRRKADEAGDDRRCQDRDEEILGAAVEHEEPVRYVSNPAIAIPVYLAS
jgi:hypothetical protein